MISRATALRLLMLLVLLTGVAAMHTIGHPVGAVHGDAARPSVMTGPSAHEYRVGSPTVAEAAHTIPAGSRSHDHDHDHDLMMNALDVCLAVVVGVLLVVAAMLGWIRRGDGHGDHVVPDAMRAGRGPPGAKRYGLTLVNLSVLRI